MTEEIFKAFFAAKDAGSDAWEKFTKEKLPELLAKMKTYSWKIGRLFLLSFLITIPLLFAGIAWDMKTLIVLAGLIRALVTVALMIVLSPVLIVIEMIRDGAAGSIKRYINSVRGLFVAELVVTAIIAWIPVKNNPDMIALLVLLLSTLSFLGSRFMSRKAAIATVSLLLALTTASFFSPYRIQSWGKSWRDSDMETGMPQRIDQSMTCNGFVRGEYRFFGDKGEPLNYFYVNYLTHDIEIYKLTSKNKTHPQTGETLEPVNKQTYYEIQKQICLKEEEARKEALRKQQEALIASSAANSWNSPASTAQTTSDSVSNSQSGYSESTYRSSANRKEYALVVMDANQNQDSSSTAAMISWLGANRAMDAYSYLDKVHTYSDGITFDDRARLRDIAQKIIYVTYQTRVHDSGGIKNGSATINVKVIDADNGNVLKTIDRTYQAQSSEANDATQIALGFAMKAVQNQFQKYQ